MIRAMSLWLIVDDTAIAAVNIYSKKNLIVPLKSLLLDTIVILKQGSNHFNKHVHTF